MESSAEFAACEEVDVGLMKEVVGLVLENVGLEKESLVLEEKLVSSQI